MKCSKNATKSPEVFHLPPGKYVLGDVENLFEEGDGKKIRTSLKKLKKKSKFGKDERLNYYYFSSTKKCYDLIEYNSSILVPSETFILIDSERVKNGKLRGCRRFTAKNEFYIKSDYTPEDFAIYFYDTNPSPFMIWQSESTI